MKNEKKRTYLLMTLPILALFICFNTIPLIQGVIYSFTNSRGCSCYNICFFHFLSFRLVFECGNLRHDENSFHKKKSGVFLFPIQV